MVGTKWASFSFWHWNKDCKQAFTPLIHPSAPPEGFLPGWCVLVIRLCLSINSQHHILSPSLSLHLTRECGVGQLSLLPCPACHWQYKSLNEQRKLGFLFTYLSIKGQLGTSSIICCLGDVVKSISDNHSTELYRETFVCVFLSWWRSGGGLASYWKKVACNLLQMASKCSEHRIFWL